MALETAATIAELNPANPVGASDAPSTLDDHIRLLKTVLQADALVEADIGVTVQAYIDDSVIVNGTASGTITLQAPSAAGTTTLSLPATSGTVALIAGQNNGLLDVSGASGGQIKFPATQNASADANTLDDYEEGTWTPSLTSFGGTGLSAVGQYTKIGNIVFANIVVSGTSVTSTAGVSRTSLPFTPSVTVAGYAVNGESTASGGAIFVTNGSVYTSTAFSSTSSVTMSGTYFI